LNARLHVGKKKNTMLKTIDSVFTRYTNHPDFGRLLLRLTFGILMLFHGVAKIGWLDLRAAGTKGVTGLYRLRRVYR
jgi:putative oxidoreductase